MFSFKTFKDTVLYYDGSTLQNKVNELKERLKTADEREKNFLENEIRKFEYGIKGENKIIYELQNSHIPMYILHDINIKYKNYEAQIDFLILTRKNYYIIECKNLYGNLTIDSKGDFYRSYNNKKEAMYNPITQVDRHISLIREYIDDRNGFIGKLIVNKLFNSIYHGIVVLANENTVFNDRFAPKNIKNRVIKADKLVEYIKRVDNSTDTFNSTEEDIKESADRVLALQNLDKIVKKAETVFDNDTLIKSNIKGDNEQLRKRLKQYRLNKARELNYKPYFIFNDNTLDEIILVKPKDKKELKKISGFADKKIEMYGQDILDIINEEI